jgi:hypothetical protein
MKTQNLFCSVLLLTFSSLTQVTQSTQSGEKCPEDYVPVNKVSVSVLLSISINFDIGIG